MFRSMIDVYVETVRYRKTPDGPQQVRRSIELDTAQAVLQSSQFLTALPILDYTRPAPMPVIRTGGKMELLPLGYDLECRTLTHSEVTYDQYRDRSTAKYVLEAISWRLASSFEHHLLEGDIREPMRLLFSTTHVRLFLWILRCPLSFRGASRQFFLMLQTMHARSPCGSASDSRLRFGHGSRDRRRRSAGAYCGLRRRRLKWMDWTPACGPRGDPKPRI